jgi:hypothetical protein
MESPRIVAPPEDTMTRIIAALIVAALLAPRPSFAQMPCATVAPNAVYVQAADTQVPVLKALGKQLRAQATPITIVYSPNGSCNNITYLYNNVFTPNVNGGTYYIPADPSFDPTTSMVPNCTPPMGQTPDLAISIIFPDATDCPTAPPMPGGIAVAQGPVQAFVFAVPGGVGTNMGSTQTTITAEEAYLIMGLGATMAEVAPWTDPTFIYGRTSLKGTQISIGANIGVPAAKWQLMSDPMHMIDQSPKVATAIAAHLSDGNAEKTLGILGTEIYDLSANRAQVHSLAFRGYKQTRSYWPDSSPTSFDKTNVRDGHYSLWSYVQYLAPAGSNGKAMSAGAQEIIDLLVGNSVTTNPALEPLDTVIGAGLVPACAMKVQRSAEGGPQSSFTPAEPCGCYYDSKVPMGKTSCMTCNAAYPCTSGVCRHGYCEAK